MLITLKNRTYSSVDVNRQFIISFTMKDGSHFLVGFRKFVELLGINHAFHYLDKAFASRLEVPTFRGVKGRYVIRFYCR